MMSYKQGIVLFIVILTLGFIVGGFIQAACFFGLVTLLGGIVVIETIKPLKWFVKKTSKVIDLILFIATIIAVAQLGVTVVGGLTIAGVGYSLIYAPYIREEHKAMKENKLPPMKNKMQELWEKEM